MRNKTYKCNKCGAKFFLKSVLHTHKEKVCKQSQPVNSYKKDIDLLDSRFRVSGGFNTCK